MTYSPSVGTSRTSSFPRDPRRAPMPVVSSLLALVWLALVAASEPAAVSPPKDDAPAPRAADASGTHPASELSPTPGAGSGYCPSGSLDDLMDLARLARLRDPRIR